MELEILKTDNYELFGSITSNREVDKRHVKKLVAAIQKKNMLHLHPIICNDKMEVVDGQHRLEAARTLGVAVYFTKDSSITKSDIASLNSNQKNWSIMDYINYFTVEKRQGFDKLSAFISQYPQIPISTALHMLSAAGDRNSAGLKDGYVDVSNYDAAIAIANQLKQYRNLIDHAYDRNFVLAIIHCNHTDGFDPETMLKKVSDQPRSLVKCISKRQYLDVLQDIYNYRASVNRITF